MRLAYCQCECCSIREVLSHGRHSSLPVDSQTTEQDTRKKSDKILSIEFSLVWLPQLHLFLEHKRTSKSPFEFNSCSFLQHFSSSILFKLLNSPTHERVSLHPNDELLRFHQNDCYLEDNYSYFSKTCREFFVQFYAS